MYNLSNLEGVRPRGLGRPEEGLALRPGTSALSGTGFLIPKRIGGIVLDQNCFRIAPLDEHRIAFVRTIIYDSIRAKGSEFYG